jgi:hypothetical protein
MIMHRNRWYLICYGVDEYCSEGTKIGKSNSCGGTEGTIKEYFPHRLLREHASMPVPGIIGTRGNNSYPRE